MQTYTANDAIVLELDPIGAPVGSERDATDILGEAFAHNATVIIIPAERLVPDFLRLRSGLAGNFIQKLQNYHCRLVIVGDISEAIAASTALRDFVYETNAIGNHRFVPNREALLAGL
ncbi:DUF4180 domain-containing protein [Devosia limi]|nr:DUF4180 domain-containing protein [Devosia limi]SHE45754.1 protein of unknown function [Devosia limi DSM 17137]